MPTLPFAPAFTRACALLLLGAIATTTAMAELRLANVFSDHMILQRDAPANVWGFAEAGETIELEFAGQKKSAVANADGKWLLTLDALPANAESRELIARGNQSTNEVTIKDVLVGDLWFCGGQSNMSIGVGHYHQSDEVKAHIAAANFPLIRQFGVVEDFATEIRDDVVGNWVVCSPQMAGRFSAVGFYFAIKLHQETGIPIGIVRSAKGSTSIEMWMPEQAIYATPEMKPIADKMKASMELYEKEKTAAIAAGIAPDADDFPPHPFGEKARNPRCVTLYNGMIAPLAPLTMRGIVWYQGEGNAHNPTLVAAYPASKRSLVESWRQTFNNPKLPFLFVQLPGYREPIDDPGTIQNWALMREAQAACLEIPNTHMAVTIDIGETDDIHPTNKFDVGARLARLALKNTYNEKDTLAYGPVFRKADVEGNAIRLHFDHTNGGLMVGTKSGFAPVTEDPDSPLRRFAIAGDNNQWHWANATIDGDTILVSSPEVPSPTAVRYAFSDNPEGANLYNHAGLPAAPFRTDKP